LPNLLVVCCVVALAGCSQPYFSRYYGEHVKRVTLTPTDAPPSTASFEQAREKWMVRLSLPDPLFSNAAVDEGRRGAPRGSGIRIWAVLYDREVIDAWVRQHSQDDSVSVEEAAHGYAELHCPSEQFRIELKMESAFAAESLNPELWVLYLEDEEGIMYEPIAIRESAVSMKERRIYSEYHDITRTRQTYRRSVDLYFRRIAFFGKELLGPETELLKLVFSYRQETMGEAVWVFAPAGGAR
jgi:hypothetical protein